MPFGREELGVQVHWWALMFLHVSMMLTVWRSWELPFFSVMVVN